LWHRTAGNVDVTAAKEVRPLDRNLAQIVGLGFLAVQLSVTSHCRKFMQHRDGLLRTLEHDVLTTP
jgi:hypothetical protein